MNRIIITAFVMLVFGCCGSALADDSEYLQYEELVLKIQQGTVKSASLGHDRLISGTIGEGEDEKNFHCWYPSNAGNDPLLTNLLRDKEVKIEIKERKRSFWSFLPLTLIFIGLPVLTLIFVLITNRRVKHIHGRFLSGGQ